MSKKVKITLISIILFGSFLRVYQLPRENLVIDEEALTVVESAPALPELTRYWFSVGHFPTYFIMMH